MENRCSHRSAELSLGKVCDSTITCPFHGFRFDAQGNCIYTPETQGTLSQNYK
ncbi:rieske (2Fe-2S) domain protein [Francisella orientalis str. Toba 04]|nr:rieske (2Fe-2S) domain protein [Francisella orientalis str. Toba 04]